MAIFLSKLRSEEELIQEPSRPLEISREMIDLQVEDYFVEEMTKLSGELFSITRSEKLNSASKAYKSPAVKHIVTQMEILITNRFGFNTTIFPMNTYCSYVSAPQHVNNNVSGDINYLLGQVKSYITKTESEMGAIVPLEDVNVDNPDVKEAKFWDPAVQDLAILKQCKTSIESLTSQCNSFGVIVDRKNARIKNLPKDFRVVLGINIAEQNLTPKEFAAIVLHEIGHSFNNIAYSGKAVNNVSVLVDTFMENVSGRNKSPKESLILAYKTAFKDSEADKLKDKNTVAVYMYVMSSTFKYGMASMTPSEVHGFNDAEQLADQFAGRFGLTKELATALSKVTINAHNELIIISLMASMFMFFMAVGIMLAPFLIIIGVMFCVCMFVNIIGSLFTVFTEHGEYQWTSYDDMPRRVQRIRNEAVRQLREVKDSPELSKAILTQIDMIDKLDKEAKTIMGTKIFSKIRNPFSKLADVIFKSRRDAINIKRIEQIQEDLTSNELYVASAKLNQIQGV